MNDDNGYFDCNQHTFSVLVLMYYGLAWSVTTTLFEVLQNACHKIKTGYRVSDPIYGNEETALSGISQGNSFGPAIWALINSIIIKICKAKGHSIKVTTLISNRMYSSLTLCSLMIQILCLVPMMFLLLV